MVYEELTKRLAMSIDGAAELKDVDPRTWTQLAREVGFALRFLEQRMAPFVEETLNVAEEMSKGSQFSEPLVQEIVTGIRKRAECFLGIG